MRDQAKKGTKRKGGKIAARRTYSAAKYSLGKARRY